MKRITIDIKEEQFSTFMAFLNTLEYVSVPKTDWWNDLNSEQKASVQRGIDDLKNGKTHSHEEVMKEAKQLIAKAKS